MSKLILCSGSRTEKPYCFTSAGIRVYSIEELCYFLFECVYLIDEDMFCDALIEWIRTELKLTERAEKLKLLKLQKADLKTMVTVLLCSADYYSEQEIKGLIKTLDEISGMPLIKRYCIKAGSYLTKQKYKEAATEYNRILESVEAISLSPEEYGDILHNLAVAKVHSSGFQEASELFCQAFERNHREESLQQLLYCLQLSGKNNPYTEKLEKYHVNDGIHNRMLNDLEKKQEEINNSEIMKKLQKLRQSKEQGKMMDFYEASDELIGEWKAEIRKF